MALVRCTSAFDYAGQQVKVGDVLDDDSIFYVRFPSKFAAFSGGTALTDQSGGTATAGGTVAEIVAAAGEATAADLATTQNAIASLGAAIAELQDRFS